MHLKLANKRCNPQVAQLSPVGLFVDSEKRRVRIVGVYFKLAEDHYGLRGHGMKLTKERSRLDTRKFFFSQRAVNGWNRIPAAVVNADTVNAFKDAYDRSYKNDMDNRSQ